MEKLETKVGLLQTGQDNLVTLFVLSAQAQRSLRLGGGPVHQVSQHFDSPTWVTVYD